MLLEAPPAGVDDGFSTVADDLRQQGFAIVVAHPERALGDPRTGWPVLERELRAGSAMQFNAWSVAGLYGDRIRLNAFRLLHTAPRVAIASGLPPRARELAA